MGNTGDSLVPRSQSSCLKVNKFHKVHEISTMSNQTKDEILNKLVENKRTPKINAPLLYLGRRGIIILEHRRPSRVDNLP